MVDSTYASRCCRRSLAGEAQAVGRNDDWTGKTRTAVAFINRLLEAGVVTRVLFLVDRIALARQAWISNRVLSSDITFRRYSNLGSCGRNPSDQPVVEERSQDLSPL